MSTTRIITPTNWIAQCQAAVLGDTLKFQAGNYDATGHGHFSLPAGCIYIGDVNTEIMGTGDIEITLTGSDVSNFIFGGNVALVLANAGGEIHGNTFKDTSQVIYNDTCNSTDFIWNDCLSTRSFFINGYPAANIRINYNYFDQTGTSQGSGDDDGAEAFHLSPGNQSPNMEIIGNVGIGLHSRWMFEIQTHANGLKIQDNYIHVTQGSGLSCATGPSGTAPFTGGGENIDISGNTFINTNGQAAQCTSCEIMGDFNISIHDNFFYGFQNCILNGTGGQRGQGLVTSNNILVYTGSNCYADGDNTPWAVPPRTSSDKVYKLGVDKNIPNPPAQPTVVGRAHDPKGTGTTVVVPPPVVVTPPPVVVVPTMTANMKATAGQTALTFSWAAQTQAMTFTLSVTGDATMKDQTFPIAAGVTNLTITKLNASWEYDGTITRADGAVNTLRAETLLNVGDATSPAPNFTPATPPPVVVVPPVVTTLTTTIKTDITNLMAARVALDTASATYWAAAQVVETALTAMDKAFDQLNADLAGGK